MKTKRTHRWRAGFTVGLVGAVLGVFPAEAPAVDFKAGDHAVTVDPGVDFGYRERTVKRLERGTKIKVTEVRDPWLGGEVTLDGEVHKGWLHKREVRRDAVVLDDLPKVSDEKSAFAAFERFGATAELDGDEHIQALDATDTGLTDEVLVHLKQFPKLSVLNLSGTAVTDAGLERLADLKTLEMLYLDRTDVTDEGLKHLSGLTDLVVLVLERSRVTGAGLESLEPLTELRTLNMSRCPVTDEQLETLGKMKNLEVFTVTHSKLQGEGLKHLQPLPKLRVLNVSENPIDEQELLHLQGAPTLKMLYIRGIKVQDDTVQSLKDTLVSCAIYRW